MDLLHWWRQGDAVTQGTALALLAMSVSSWVVICWKAWLLRHARRDVQRSAARLLAGAIACRRAAAPAAFRPRCPRPALVVAIESVADDAGGSPSPGATLATRGSRSQQLTRLLRGALHGVLARLQFGQVLLATVGATAPFVGLLGTVWGIFHALTAIAGAGQISIERVAARWARPW